MSLFSPASHRRSLLERMLQSPAANAGGPRSAFGEGA